MLIIQSEIKLYGLAHMYVTIKLNFRLNTWKYTSPEENFKYSYPLNIQWHVYTSIQCQHNIHVLTMSGQNNHHVMKPPFKLISCQIIEP